MGHFTPKCKLFRFSADAACLWIVSQIKPDSLLQNSPLFDRRFCKRLSRKKGAQTTARLFALFAKNVEVGLVHAAKQNSPAVQKARSSVITC